MLGISRRISGSIAAAAVAVVAIAPAQAVVDSTMEFEVLCTFDDPRLVEISGLVPSNIHPGVIWLHNDSSDAARIYGVDSTTCETVAEVTMDGVSARDVESISSSFDAQGRAVLWVADIGDNRDSWPNVGLYRIREPKKLGDRTKQAREYRFTYPDRPHNAETVLVDTDRIWVATWQLASGGLYELVDPKRRGVNIAERVGDVGSLITDGAIAPDRSGYLLRDYLDVHVFQGLPPGRKIATLPLPFQPQGEAIAWTEDSRGVLIASEGDDRLIRAELPWWVRASLRPPDHLVPVP